MRAKLKIVSSTKTEHSEVLKFTAVSKSGAYPADGADEDNTYAKFTPTAELQITVTNPALIGKLQPGETYYVDFTKAD